MVPELEWQSLGVAADESQAMLALSSFSSGFYHLLVNIADDGAGSGAGPFEEAGGDVAGAPGNVQEREGLMAFGGCEHGHELVFPQPVQAAGHQIVHQVVAAGDTGKHAIDEALLGLGRHRGKAKAGPLVDVFLFGRVGHAFNIAQAWKSSYCCSAMEIFRIAGSPECPNCLRLKPCGWASSRS